MELLGGKTGLLQDMGQRGSFDQAMRRYGELEHIGPGVLLEPYVASSLTDDDPAVPFERCDDLPV